MACSIGVSICRAGRVTEGNHGHASLRLPSNGSGSLHGHRNGSCDAPPIGAVKSLLFALPTAAPNGWHSILASRGGTSREHARRGCESSLVKVFTERPGKRPQEKPS